MERIREMRNRLAPVFLFVLMVFPVLGYQQPSCDMPELSAQEAKDIIERERAARTDLPAPFPESTWTVRRQGCHYVYVEYAVPAAPEQYHLFKLNQHGGIVDATPGKLKCPEKIFKEDELAEVVRKAREKRKGLPPAFSSQETRVERLRCMYLYFEYATPKVKGEHHVFIIDPLGELMDFQRGKPR